MSVRTLEIVACEVAFQGKNRSGGDMTIYNVTARKADGTPVDLPLRSFDQLPLGVAEYSVEPYDGTNGRTYTLKDPNAPSSASPGARLGPKVDELRDRIDLLEQTVGEMQTDLKALGDVVARLTSGRSDTDVAPVSPPSDIPATPRQPAGAFTDPDDIPF